MKNKNIHSFRNGSPLFYEGRRLFQTSGPEVAKARTEAKLGKERSIKFINLMGTMAASSLTDVEIPVTGEPGDFLDANPFRNHLYEYMKVIPFDSNTFEFTSAEDKTSDGALDFQYEVDSKAAQIHIDKLAYVALMWEKIKPALSTALSDKLGKVSVNDFCTKMAELGKPSFENLVLAIAKNPDGVVDDALIDLALYDFDIVRRGTGPKARASVKATVDSRQSREELADKIREERYKLETDMAGKLVYWRMSIVGRERKIDPKRWDITKGTGLDIIKNDWKDMGILDQKPMSFFENGSTGIFDIFRKAQSNIASKSDSEKAIYLDPLSTENFERLDELTDDEGRAFAEAVRYFKKINDIAVAQDTYRSNQTDVMQTKDREPITAALGKALKDNGRVFVESLRSGDYTTAGAYVLGLWAIYKAYDKLDSKNKDEWGKWAFRGAAVYAAHIFAKNAGFDALKKLGITDLDAELKDTSLDSMYDYMPEMKNVDSDIVLRMSNTNIGDLYEQYEKTNGNATMKARRWIDPAKFRTEFGDKKYSYFAGMRPSMAFKAGRSSDKEREYRRVGKQLYLLVEALKHTYDGAMRHNETRHFSSFDELVKRHPVFRNSTVLDFTVALRAYVIDIGKDRKLLGLEEGTKLQERLDEVFKPEKIGYSSDRFKGSDGVFFGTVMDFPMVFLRAKDGIKVVPRHKYNESAKGAVGVYAIATIPYEGAYNSPSVKGAVRSLKNRMVESMKKRHKIFVKNDNRGVDLSEPVWDDNAAKWRSTLIFSGRDPLVVGTEEQAVTVYLTPGDDGKGLSVISKDNDIVIHIKNVLDPQKIRESLILAALVRQQSTTGGGNNFGALKWFLLTNRLHFKDEKQGDLAFHIRVGTSNWIEIKRVGSIYKMSAKDEKALLESHNFQKDLADAVGERYFDDTIKTWDQLIDNTHEDYLWNFFTSIPGWFTEATSGDWFRGMKLKSLTGSVAKNYTKGLVRTQKQAVLSKFMYHIGKAKSLNDVNDNITSILIPGRNNLKRAAREFSNMNAKNSADGKEYSAQDFEYKVLNNLIGVVHKSSDYKIWYKDFMHEVYSKYGMDDLRTRRAAIANDILGIYAHYTAPLDDLDIDGANLNLKMKFTPDEAKNIEMMIELKRKLKRLPTLAEMNVELPSLAQADYDKAKTNLPGFEKMTRHLRARAYVDHVKERIWSYVGSRTDGASIPGPCDDWEIIPFDNFEVDVVRTELVDTTPPLRMSRDYVTLDQWLTFEKGKADMYKPEDLLWPRGNVNMKVYRTGAKSWKLAMVNGVKNLHAKAFANNDLPKMTDLEIYYKNRVDDLTAKLKARYDGSYGKATIIQPDFDQMISDLFRVNFLPKVVNRGKDADGEFLMISSEPHPGIPADPTTGTLASRGSTMSLHIAQIEKTLSTSHRTLTAPQQMKKVDDYIRQYFDRNVLSGTMFDKYFERKTIPGAIGVWLREAKVFLIGW